MFKKKDKTIQEKKAILNNLKNLPNNLTLLRVALVPIILLVMLFPYEQFKIVVPNFTVGFVKLSITNILVFFLFLFASITDWLDGFIARKYNLETNLGKFLDPLADKLLTTTLFIVYATMGVIPVVAVVLMVWRDLMVDGIRMVCAGANVVVSAGILGKIKTVSQMLALMLIILNNLPFELFNFPMAGLMLWFSVGISLISGFVYLYQAKDIVLSKETNAKDN